MALVVYPKSPYCYIWADNNESHKQGKAFPAQPLRIDRQTGDWYQIQPLPLDRPVDLDLYPNYWVKKSETVVSHGNGEPEPEGCLAGALKWLLELT